MRETGSYESFKIVLKNACGLDLELYKETQINRRLLGYMQRHQLKDYGELEKHIAGKTQATQLIDYLDINVSEFFRNPDLFVFLEKEILSKAAVGEVPMRIWSAGCSIGAEPYSIAIAVAEAKFRTPPTLWATDLDRGALQQAQLGHYTLGDVRNVAPDRLAKYFEIAGNEVTVKSLLKERINFAKHDLLQDPIREKFNLIACRNVAIYFTEEAKANMLKRFASALAEGGILFTGATESYLNYRDFGFIRLQSCFYQKAGN